MPSFLQILRETSAHPSVYSGLARGDTLSAVAQSEGLTPVQAIAGFVAQSLGSHQHPCLGLTRATPIPGKFDRSLGTSSLAESLNAKSPTHHAFSAGLLQCVDHWDASHEAAQEIETGPAAKLSAWWHAIAHRREPDAFNANYWVRKAGPWPESANAALLDLLKFEPIESSSRFLKATRWQPDLYFQAVAHTKRDSDDALPLRQLQRLEFIALLDATWEAVVP